MRKEENAEHIGDDGRFIRIQEDERVQINAASSSAKSVRRFANEDLNLLPIRRIPTQVISDVTKAQTSLTKTPDLQTVSI